ncbi:MAG TPA: Ku protein [Steroidobacteraceae bacterium]
MARAFWKGAISFGLVYIPVELYSLAQGSTIDLDYLDRRDFAPIGYQRYNKRTGKPVEWKNIVRGYQYEKGRYVALSEEDFRRANPKAAQTIEITSFTQATNIAPEFYDTPYLVAAQKGGEKVYALLREALKRAGKVAVANVVVRTRQHLAALLPQDALLTLNTLRFADELRLPADLGVTAPAARAAGLASKELSMAERLIEEMSEPWEPRKYHDTYREDLMARIKEKIRARETHTLTAATRAAKPQKTAEVIDLMAVLKQSLEQGGRRRPAAHARHAKSGRKKSARA